MSCVCQLLNKRIYDDDDDDAAAAAAAAAVCLSVIVHHSTTQGCLSVYDNCTELSQERFQLSPCLATTREHLMTISAVLNNQSRSSADMTDNVTLSIVGFSRHTISAIGAIKLSHARWAAHVAVVIDTRTSSRHASRVVVHHQFCLPAYMRVTTILARFLLAGMGIG